MRFVPALLRVPLVLALIANGATSAFAATLMQVAQFTEQAAETKAVEVAQSAKSPCHEGASISHVSKADTEVSAVDTPDTAADTKHGSPPDCCKSEKCLCACMHHAVATLASVHFLAASVDHASCVRRLNLGYAAPALRRLIRPPIG